MAITNNIPSSHDHDLEDFVGLSTELDTIKNSLTNIDNTTNTIDSKLETLSSSGSKSVVAKYGYGKVSTTFTNTKYETFSDNETATTSFDGTPQFYLFIPLELNAPDTYIDISLISKYAFNTPYMISSGLSNITLVPETTYTTSTHTSTTSMTMSTTTNSVNVNLNITNATVSGYKLDDTISFEFKFIVFAIY